MKGRTWVLAVIILVILAVGGIAVSVRYYHLDSLIRGKINGIVSNYLGGEFESSSVYITPLSFGLRDVRFRLSEAPVTVEAKRVRIEFNLLSLIKNRFRLVSGTRNIFLDEPRFIWHLGGELSQAQVIDFNPETEISLPILPTVRIHLVKGALIFTRNDSTLVMADNIGGLLDARSEKDILLNAHGRLLSDTVNTRYTGNINRENGDITFEVESQNCDFSRKNLEIVTGDLIPGSGFFDFNIEIEKKDDSFRQNGVLSVRDGAFTVKESGITASNVSVEASIDGNEVILQSVSGKVFGVTPELSGRLRLKPQAELSLSLKADNIDIGYVIPELFPGRDIYPSGVAALESTIEGTLRELTVNMNITSDSLAYDSGDIHNLDVRASISEGMILVERFRGVMDGYRLTGRGKAGIIDETNDRSDYSVSLTAVPVDGEGRLLSLSANGTIRPKIEDYSASYRFAVRPASGNTVAKDVSPDSLFTFTGTLHLVRDALEFTARNGIARLSGKASDIYGRRAVDSELILTGCPVLKYAGIESDAFIIEGKNRIGGYLDSLIVQTKMNLYAGENLDSILSGTVAIEHILDGNRKMTLNAVLDDHHLRFSHPLKWDVTARSDSVMTKAVIRDPDGAVLAISADHDTGALSGTLDLQNLPLEWIIDVFKKEEFSHRGKLTGRAVIGGTLRNPDFHTPERIQVTDLKIGGLDRLTGSGYVSGHSGELAFSKIELERDGIHIMNTDSKWEDGKPYILEARGDDIQLGAVSDIISKDRMTDGTVDYNAKLVFTRKSGSIEGAFTLRNGHFLDIPIDTASGVIGGGSDGFTVTDFSATKEGVYTGRGSATSGYIWRDRNEAPGLKMDLFFQGNLLSVLPHLTGSIKKADGNSRLSLRIGGTWEEPSVMGADLYVAEGVIEPSFLVDRITDINGTMTIDTDFETITGLNAVRIKGATATILEKKLLISNIHVGDPAWVSIEKPELLSVINTTAGLDFGVILGRIERGNQRDASLVLNVPGFMKPKDTGTFILGGDYENSFYVGASDTGDDLSPYIGGRITVLSGDIYYPLLQVETDGGDSDFLEDIFWNVIVEAGPNVNYMHEENIAWRVGGTTVSRTMARLDENSRFTVIGRLSDDSFCVTGSADSNSGLITYYGTEFDIERAEFRLDSANQDRPATLAAQARTVVFDDSTGAETEIRLNVYFIDKLSGERRDTLGRTNVLRDDFRVADTSRTIDAGALGTLQVEFSSSNPSDNTMEKILARLGISTDNIVGAATGAFAAGVDNYYFDSLMRPFEDVIRKYMRIDVVRFTPSVLGNVMRSQLGFDDRFGPDKDYMLFDRSRIMLGEYFLDDFFLSYRGQYGLGRDYLSRKERGFFHEIGLQYLLERNTRFQFNYNYDEIINKGEKRIEIRHDFEF